MVKKYYLNDRASDFLRQIRELRDFESRGWSNSEIKIILSLGISKRYNPDAYSSVGSISLDTNVSHEGILEALDSLRGREYVQVFGGDAIPLEVTGSCKEFEEKLVKEHAYDRWYTPRLDIYLTRYGGYAYENFLHVFMGRGETFEYD